MGIHLQNAVISPTGMLPSRKNNKLVIWRSHCTLFYYLPVRACAAYTTIYKLLNQVKKNTSLLIVLCKNFMRNYKMNYGNSKNKYKSYFFYFFPSQQTLNYFISSPYNELWYLARLFNSYWALDLGSIYFILFCVSYNFFLLRVMPALSLLFYLISILNLFFFFSIQYLSIFYIIQLLHFFLFILAAFFLNLPFYFLVRLSYTQIPPILFLFFLLFQTIIPFFYCFYFRSWLLTLLRY